MTVEILGVDIAKNVFQLGQYHAYRGWFTKPIGGSVLTHDIIAKTWTLVSS